jgi:hypothetical protein
MHKTTIHLAFDTQEEIKLYTEERAYTLDSFFADIGGNAGLLIGISILALVDLYLDRMGALLLGVKVVHKNKSRRNFL